MFDPKSDYALNKMDPEAIVYIDSRGTLIRLTVENFASDIIALNRGGVVTCHYCDSFGFEQLTDFLTPKPTVAELEDQAKNGQPFSLMELSDAIHRENKQKKSVVAQLKGQPQPGRKKTAPKKSAER